MLIDDEDPYTWGDPAAQRERSEADEDEYYERLGADEQDPQGSQR